MITPHNIDRFKALLSHLEVVGAYPQDKPTGPPPAPTPEPIVDYGPPLARFPHVHDRTLEKRTVPSPRQDEIIFHSKRVSLPSPLQLDPARPPVRPTRPVRSERPARLVLTPQYQLQVHAYKSLGYPDTTCSICGGELGAPQHEDPEITNIFARLIDEVDPLATPRALKAAPRDEVRQVNLSSIVARLRARLKNIGTVTEPEGYAAGYHDALDHFVSLARKDDLATHKAG